MTRSGAPVQGASGDGKTVISAGLAQLSDAAAAGDSAIEKSKTKKSARDQQGCCRSGRKAARKKHFSITLAIPLGTCIGSAGRQDWTIPN